MRTDRKSYRTATAFISTEDTNVVLGLSDLCHL